MVVKRLRTWICTAATDHGGWCFLTDSFSDDAWSGFTDVMISPDEDLDYETVLFIPGSPGVYARFLAVL